MTERSPTGQFVKGVSGNPAGSKPKAQTFAHALRAQLDLERDGQTTRERVAAVVLERCLAGDLQAIAWLVDRVDGKVPDRLEADLEHRHHDALDDTTRLRVLAYAARRALLPGIGA